MVASLIEKHGLFSTGSTVVGHGLSCSAACGILPDQGWSPCFLHWQVDSLPLRHHGSPPLVFVLFCFVLGKEWIYSKRNTSQTECGPSQRAGHNRGRML